MKKFDIDVVIPLFNKEKTITRCLNSVLSQTVLPNRVIIVDDGSTDDSLQIALDIQSSQRSSAKISLLSHTNKGVSFSRNRGVQYSNAKYIAFLDADDFWDESFIEQMLELIELSQNSVFWSCGHKEIKGEDSVNNFDFSSIPTVVDNYAKYAFQVPVVNSSKVIVRRDSFLTSGMFSEAAKVAEDLDIWLKLASIGKLGFTQKVLANIDKTPALYRTTRTVFNIPYPVTALSKNKFIYGRLDRYKKKYILKVALIHGLFSLIHGERRTLRTSALCFRKISWPYSLLLYFLSLLPPFVLKFIYAMRK